MKPLLTLVSMMEQPVESGPYFELMDVRIQRMALGEKKIVSGLETATEQIISLDVLNLKEQAELMLTVLQSDEGLAVELDEMQRLYVQQDFAKLMEHEMMDEYPEKLIHELVNVRNHRFFDRLLPLLKKNRVFCVLGAMHLPGETGLIAQLRNAGYKVEPVDFTFTKSALEKK